MNRITEAVRAEKEDKIEQADATAKALADILHSRIGPQKFNAWFKHGTRLTLEEGIVKVTVPNPFVANWIETHYQDQISAAAAAMTGRSLGVLVTIDPALSGQLRKTQLDTQAHIVDRAANGRSREAQGPEQVIRHRLDEFVVGESNRLAYSAALAAGSGDVTAFNPLFIHGSCGVGKTHLLQGICGLASRRIGRGGGARRGDT